MSNNILTYSSFVLQNIVLKNELYYIYIDKE